MPRGLNIPVALPRARGGAKPLYERAGRAQRATGWTTAGVIQRSKRVEVIASGICLDGRGFVPSFRSNNARNALTTERIREPPRLKPIRLRRVAGLALGCTWVDHTDSCSSGVQRINETPTSDRSLPRAISACSPTTSGDEARDRAWASRRRSRRADEGAWLGRRPEISGLAHVRRARSARG